MTISVTYGVEGHVAHIHFAKPPYNYACPQLLGQIADCLEKADADADVRCSVLSSEGKAFCAGADLAGDDSITSGDGMVSIGQLYVQAERIFRRAKPMVAAVQGGAIGAGLGLAVAADFRVADPTTRLSANFVRLGFHPGFALTCTLPRLLGQQRASWMMLSAERVKPDAALAWGLVDRIAEPGQSLADAMAMAREIADNAPLALVAVRRTLNDGLGDAVAAAMRHEHAQQTALKGTQDYAEGVASVFDRRPARFKGR